MLLCNPGALAEAENHHIHSRLQRLEHRSGHEIKCGVAGGVDDRMVKSHVRGAELLITQIGESLPFDLCRECRKMFIRATRGGQTAANQLEFGSCLGDVLQRKLVRARRGAWLRSRPPGALPDGSGD